MWIIYKQGKIAYSSALFDVALNIIHIALGVLHVVPGNLYIVLDILNIVLDYFIYSSKKIIYSSGPVLAAHRQRGPRTHQYLLHKIPKNPWIITVNLRRNGPYHAASGSTSNFRQDEALIRRRRPAILVGTIWKLLEHFEATRRGVA